MNTQTKRLIPKYTLEFKKDAASLVNEKGYTHQQAADQTELTRLCRENEQLRMERVQRKTYTLKIRRPIAVRI